MMGDVFALLLKLKATNTFYKGNNIVILAVKEIVMTLGELSWRPRSY